MVEIFARLPPYQSRQRLVSFETNKLNIDTIFKQSPSLSRKIVAMPKSPTSPRNSGFIPLRPLNSIDTQTNQQAGLSASNAQNNDHIVDIPLTTIKTNTSTTGARKEGQAIKRPNFARNETEETHDGIFHKHMGRRRNRTGGDASLVDDEGALTAMGKLYEKVLNFSIVTRYLLYLVPLSMCFVAVMFIGIYVAPEAAIGGDDKHKGVRIVWFFIWVCCLYIIGGIID